MRWWRQRRSFMPAEPPSEDLLAAEEALRTSIGDILSINDRQIRGGVIIFRGTLTIDAARASNVMRERFRPYGYTPYVRTGPAGVVVQAWPTADTVERPRVALSVALFAFTCLSTLLAGAMYEGVVDFTVAPSWLLAGLPFAGTLIVILGVHEFGHYFTARHYGATVSLPYFIPAPPPLFLFGTLGAIIRMRSPVRDRNALLDIAAAGPLAGLVLALPAMILGLSWSTLHPAPPGEYLHMGDSAATMFLTWMTIGAVPEGMILESHPIGIAGWAGLFVTALNLFPVGQLDGGRIAYALFGRRHRVVGFAVFAATLALGAITMALNWFVWAGLIFFLIGFGHGAPLDDVTPLSPARRLVGWACLVLFVLLIPPVPLSFG